MSKEYLNQVGLSLRPSETLAVKSKAAERKASGLKVIDLSTGEPDIDTPQHIKDAAWKALEQGKTKYTDVAGIKELREAIAAKLKKDNAITNASVSNVIVTNGGKQALHHAFAVTIRPGDEVIVPAPYWVSYLPMIDLAGGKAVVVNTKPEDGYKLRAKDLLAAITTKTRAIILNSPSNPTGATYSAAEFNELRDALVTKAPHALIVSDEVYEKVIFRGHSFTSVAQVFPELLPRLITINAFSKSYSMTGWRVGYACGPQEIIGAMAKLQSQTTSNVNAPAQYAAIAALQGDQSFLAGMNTSFERRVDAALAVIRETPGLEVIKKPEGAFYLFVRFAALQAMHPSLPQTVSAGALVNYLLESQGVAAVPGDAFGDPQAFRISVASDDATIANGVEGIRAAVTALL